MKKILILGASGLVGSRFVELYGNKFVLVAPSSREVDITSVESINNYINLTKFDIAVNFAANTNLNEAESQRGNKNESCWKVNVDGVRNIIDALPEGVKFIQISTDYVFPGNESDKGPYTEKHFVDINPNKLSWYGYTKAEAEKIVTGKYGKDTTIVRLAFPFCKSYSGKLDVARKILDLYDNGKLYPMFVDQKISVTYIDQFCIALSKIIQHDYRGIFHVSSSNTTTPYEFASYLLEKARHVKDVVKPLRVEDFPGAAESPLRYPKYGGLSVTETQKKLKIKFFTWQKMVDKFIYS